MGVGVYYGGYENIFRCVGGRVFLILWFLHSATCGSYTIMREL